MDINSATNAISSRVEEGHSVARPSDLSAQERIFCDVFVTNGGKAGEAARAAGYADASADVSASRLLCRSRVATHIKNQCGKFSHAALPVAIRTLVEIAGDPEALRKDRIKAANSLIELGGMAAPKGGIQVNVGVVNGSQAQQIIAEVHDARVRRLSDIPPAMSDSMKQLESSIDALATPLAGDDRGGDQLQGPVAGTGPLPAPSSTERSQTDDSHLASRDHFRRAFEDGDDAGD